MENTLKGGASRIYFKTVIDNNILELYQGILLNLVWNSHFLLIKDIHRKRQSKSNFSPARNGSSPSKGSDVGRGGVTAGSGL